MSKKYLFVTSEYKVYNNKRFFSSKCYSVIELIGKSTVDYQEKLIFQNSDGNIVVFSNESVKQMLKDKYFPLNDIGSPAYELKEIKLLEEIK